MSEPDPLEAARTALERHDWRDALDALDGLPRTADALELRAQAAYGCGDFEESVSAWESLHSLLVSEGDRTGAARAAAMVAMYLMMDTGLMAPVRGWLRRAERLLDTDASTPADALVAMTRTYERFMCGDMAQAQAHAAVAIDLGTRFDVLPAVIIGRVASARVRIFDGDVEEGLALLDEVGAVLMSGDVDPLTTGMMYCELICAAQGLAMHDLATEWTDVMERWRHDGAVGGINGRCRVHRAELLRMSGPCDLAEAEALAACEELRPWMRREFGWPLVELGMIRLRKGDLEGAESAFLEAHQHAWSPEPGLSLLRLAQGDADTAAASIADAIVHPFDVPSKERPPFGDLRMAPLLDAQSEIAAARGDAETAIAAAVALQHIAETYASRSIAACASLAEARAALVSGDLDQARDASAAAVAGWADIGAPYETAVARLVLAEAHQRSDNHAAAQMERSVACAAFEAFGAARCAELARDASSQAEAGSKAPPPAPTAAGESDACFRCDGDTRTIRFGGTSTLIRDLKGLRYVERLLAEPGREFHVLDLVATETGAPASDARHDPDAGPVSRGADAGLTVIDDQARDAYRRRLADVDEDIEDALACNDLGRAELAQRDRDYLLAELASAVGIGGRSRTTGGTTERARTSVTRAIRYGLARVAEHHPALALHLEQHLNTGTYCVYCPDPVAPVIWDV